MSLHVHATFDMLDGYTMECGVYSILVGKRTPCRYKEQIHHHTLKHHRYASDMALSLTFAVFANIRLVAFLTVCCQAHEQIHESQDMGGRFA